MMLWFVMMILDKGLMMRIRVNISGARRMMRATSFRSMMTSSTASHEKECNKAYKRIAFRFSSQFCLFIVV